MKFNTGLLFPLSSKACQTRFELFLGWPMPSLVFTPARRRVPRVPSPDVWVYWEGGKHRDVSRVRDLSPAGLFVETRFRQAEGDLLELHLLVQEGRIRLEAQVRHISAGEGFGLKLNSVATGDLSQFDALLSRVRSAAPNPIVG